MADETVVAPSSARRSLAVLLVAIGLVSTGSYLKVRDVTGDLSDANGARAALSGQLDALLANQEVLLARMTASERQAAARQAALERALAAFLAGSSDPAVAGPLADLGVTPDPATDRRPAPTRSSPTAVQSPPSDGRTVTTSPRPSVTPKPAPSPSPSRRPAVVTVPPVPVPCTAILCTGP